MIYIYICIYIYTDTCKYIYIYFPKKSSWNATRWHGEVVRLDPPHFTMAISTAGKASLWKDALFLLQSASTHRRNLGGVFVMEGADKRL